ncbi:protein CLEC16A isoform X1 [Centruroides vittatus]|uniref:protein CLEC16A isoform X1 n=1 Tax=Centruroides vittatus TaxID=120091 RepID=UPI00350F4E95
MFRGKGWFSGGLWKPKNPHSLEHLKFLYQLLSKNQTVTEQNKGLLVETLRSIAEILIWGDQNDSTVFDFFLEKNMLSFFLKIMKQKCGRYVCVQLLQTLNILFENIRNETSLYYLLSNNHVNSIIVHKFDFSDEEVMAYYISFLKTLSLKLNTHTIHFFYNEHTNDFPLYTEAIKFFNHGESMVRIAVRTLTLNVFKVDDKAMLKFIRDKTAAPYFSNLVWFIGNHVLELDSCVRKDADHQSYTRLADLVAEHLDHLHYLNDILCLQIEALNEVLTDHLLNRLLIPLYVYSLTKRRRHSQIEDDRPHVSSVVSLFLLSQVFLIISHHPLVQQLAFIILNRTMTVFSSQKHELSSLKVKTNSEPEFIAPEETLEKSLETKIYSSHSLSAIASNENASVQEVTKSNSSTEVRKSDISAVESSEASDHRTPDEAAEQAVVDYPSDGTNITDEEKVEAAQRITQSQFEYIQQNFSLNERPFLEAIFNALECPENDHAALFGLCLFYALGHNSGINQDLLDQVLMPTEKSETKQWYNINLVERLIKIINLSCQYKSRIRLATLQMSLLLLKQLVIKDGQSFLQDRHLAAIEQAREESTLLLRNFYKSEEIFLDMFEDEYQEMKKKPLNVEYLMMDSNLLLPPTGTPMSGVEFHKRLPCGEVERARRAIRVFFLLRDLSLTLQEETETQLPLTNIESCIKVNDVLDLTHFPDNSDLIACAVIMKDGQKIRRFMVIDVLQLILVEPDGKRLGWGVAKFVGFLQDIEVTGDKDDSRCLHITVHRPASAAAGNNRSPLLTAKFLFDDHIRCMAAKQRLTKGRLKARQKKMYQIARLLDLPEHIQPCPSPLKCGFHSSRDHRDHSSALHRSQSQDTGLRGRTLCPSGSQGPYRPLFTSINKVPGFAKLKRESQTSETTTVERRRTNSSPLASSRNSHSRDSSPRQRANSSSEEIPLEDLSKNWSSRHNSPNLSRKSSSGLPQARINVPTDTSHRSPGNPVIVNSKDGLAISALDDSSHFSDKCTYPVTKNTGHTQTSKLPPGSAGIVLGTLTPLPPAETELSLDENLESPPSVCTKPCCATESSSNEEREHAANDFEENDVFCSGAEETATEAGSSFEARRRATDLRAQEISNQKTSGSPTKTKKSSSKTKHKGAIQTV